MTMTTKITCSTTQGMSPVDLRRLDGRRGDAAQVQQREAKRRVHEARLDVGADQHAKPNEIDPELVGDGGQQRNDDESDLEEIEEERHHEDESVGEDEKAQLTAGKGGEQLLDPQLATDPLEDEAEY